MGKKTVFTNLTNAQIVKHLADGDTVKSIGITYGINVRTMEDKVERIRLEHDCNCIVTLVSKYLKNEIEV